MPDLQGRGFPMTGAWFEAASKLRIVTQLANIAVTRILQTRLILRARN